MHRKAGVTILISDKIDFNKNITKNKTQNLNYTINLKEFEFVIFFKLPQKKTSGIYRFNDKSYQAFKEEIA